MRTAISRLELLRPRSVSDALRMLRDEGPLTPLAGATDLYVAVNFGTLTETRFLNLWNLEPLRRITSRDGVLHIGALATYTALTRSRLVRRHLPMLVSAAREVGGLQIQNRGTLGGNVANGSPAGDTLPVLAAADAIVVLRSLDGERRIPFGEFYTGYRTSARRADELIVGFDVPPIDGTQWFRKVGTRAAQAISKVVMAAVRGPSTRIALGSVAPTVIRLRGVEEALAGGASLDEAARRLDEDIRPIDDLRSTAAYRRDVTANLLRRFWTDTTPSADSAREP
jgi:xanthine dehydrogenase small subunit